MILRYVDASLRGSSSGAIPELEGNWLAWFKGSHATSKLEQDPRVSHILGLLGLRNKLSEEKHLVSLGSLTNSL
eukprot:5406366-Lingulodinium_polyedra.AAC.1